MYLNHFYQELSATRKRVFGLVRSLTLVLLALMGTSLIVNAQAPAIVGTLGNFDVLNNTGEETHGFEIQVEGISKADIYRIFGNWSGTNVIRYGAGTATDYPGGVYIRWMSPWDPNTQTFTLATPVPVNRTTVPGESCWTLGMGDAYYSAGCEHFGISAYKNGTAVTYRWLVADPNNPGALIPSTTTVSLPAPIWTVVAPVVVGNPPIVVAQIEAPPAPEPVQQFGDAQWVKVYKTENGAEVQLEDLVGGNAAVVPQNAAQLEVDWDLIQQDPLVGHQKRKGKQVNAANLGNGSHAVVRRYEYYQYSGAYDPLTHEALCGGDGSCNVPLDGELGDAVGAQNVAANLNVPSLTVTNVGNGQVSSADKAISCGNKCFSYYVAGTAVTLTAKAGSGNTFSSWSGACSGAQLTCVVSITDALATTATFVATPPAGGGGGGGAAGGGGGGGGGVVKPTLSVKTAGGKGTIVSAPSAISCGTTCSAPVSAGSTFTLSATPDPGFRFVNWSGACSGTALTCQVTVNSSTSVQANFSK